MKGIDRQQSYFEWLKQMRQMALDYNIEWRMPTDEEINNIISENKHADYGQWYLEQMKKNRYDGKWPMSEQALYKKLKRDDGVLKSLSYFEKHQIPIKETSTQNVVEANGYLVSLKQNNRRNKFKKIGGGNRWSEATLSELRKILK